jgi:peptidoglycan/LPS O-acetylase OafA/YrhL
VTSLRTSLTLSLTNSWFIHGSGLTWSPYNFPSWTVTTLTFFYLVFPLLLPAMQRLTTSQLASLTVWLHYVQFLPAFCLSASSSEQMMKVTTAHPIFRLPVFMMGVAAGLVRLRQEDDPYIGRRFLHCLLPWGFSAPSRPPTLTQEEKEAVWTRRVDTGVVCLVAFVVVCQPLGGLGLRQYFRKLFGSGHYGPNYYGQFGLDTMVKTRICTVFIKHREKSAYHTFINPKPLRKWWHIIPI